jgi:molybdopterin-synthase adenylyltransferase
MKMYSRQSFLGPNSQALLVGARVAIVGACGGGSHVVQQLAHIGVGTIIVIDPQRIDGTNLHRLVGATWLDVVRHTPKVLIAKRVVKAVNPKAAIIPLQCHWQDQSAVLLECDVVVGCLDSPRAKNELEAFCRRFLIPYVDIGMDVHGAAGEHLIAGQVVLSMPGAPCLQCLSLITEEDLAREAAQYGAAGGLPQVVWPNGVLASSAVGIVMQILTPWYNTPIQSVYLHYDGNSGVIAPSHRHKLALARPCPHYPANERGDPGFDVRKAPSRASRSNGTNWLRALRKALRRSARR